MKSIKNLALLSMLLLLIVFSACSNEDDYVPPFGDFSSFTWWSSRNNNQLYNSPIKEVQKDRFLAFKNLSRGTVSRKWEISEGAAFLTSNFNEQDTLDYAQYINPNVGNSTSDDLIYVLFTELGDKEVTLTCTFKDSISGFIAYGDNPNRLTEETILPVKIGENWELTQKITVTVTE